MLLMFPLSDFLVFFPSSSCSGSSSSCTAVSCPGAVGSGEAADGGPGREHPAGAAVVSQGCHQEAGHRQTL